MRRLLLALILAWAPLSPAAADVDEIDVSPLLQCVEAADHEAEALRACQGVITQPCFDAPFGETTSGMVMCLSAEGDGWARIMDESLARLAAGNVELAPALAETQAAWSAYREEECSYRVQRWGMGSGAQVEFASCQAQLAADRAITLLRYEPTAD
jgi:uncharacterized protein YecT (DUF1311 family)